jgi:hypothetical protein
LSNICCFMFVHVKNTNMSNYSCDIFSMETLKTTAYCGWSAGVHSNNYWPLFIPNQTIFVALLIFLFSNSKQVNTKDNDSICN